MRNIIKKDPDFALLSHFLSQELGLFALDRIVEFTSEYFDIEYSHIALIQEDPTVVSVIAAYLDGKVLEPGYSYSLQDTPCKEVLQKSHQCHNEHIQQLFPNDIDLVTLQAESYIGEPILSHKGDVIGLIVLVSRRKLESSALITSVIKMIAGRVGLELSHSNMESMLRKEHDTLQLILDYAPIGIWLQDGNGKIGFVNKAFSAAVGIPEQTFLDAKHYIDLIPERFKPQCIASDVKALSSSDISVTQQQLPFVDGNIHDLKVIKAVKRDENGSPIALIGLSLDITEELIQQKQLQENQTLLRTVIDEMPSILVLKDEKGDFLLCNRTLAEFYGTTPEEIVGKHDDDFGVPKEIADEFRSNVLEIMAKGQTTIVMEESRDAATGQIRHFRSIKKPLKDADGRNRILVIATDITDIIESQKKVAESEHLLKEIMGIAKEGIWDWDIPTGRLSNNQEWHKVLHATEQNTCTTIDDFTRLIHPDDREKVWNRVNALLQGEMESYFSEHRMLRFDGSEIWVQDRGKIIERDDKGSPIRMVGAFNDITDQKNYQKELEHIAHYDPLTSLPNRILNADRLQQALYQSQRRNSVVAILYLDLDGFKPINDQYGHDIGDLLLIDIAKRVGLTLRDGDTLSRLGGDEFIAILTDLSSTEQATVILDRILESFKHPVFIDDIALQVTASIGVTFYPQKEEADGDLLIRQADLAMYNAKQSGKNRYHIFDADHDQTIRTRHKMVEKIKHALDQNEFILHFQPKVNMRTGKLLGAEALIRWNRPNEKLIYPMEFLPFIENELISIELGEWVIREALSHLCLFKQRNLDITISVNVSALQLLSSHFPQRLHAILGEFPDIDPTQLEIEILETSALEDLNTAIAVIKECTLMGIQFSLDDFGTGYSSLSYLKRLPISTLKIDQSFVKDMGSDLDDLVIVQGIIGLADAFNKKVIAEGVETEILASKLISLGCEIGQGFGIGHPMPIRHFFEWATKWEAKDNVYFATAQP